MLCETGRPHVLVVDEVSPLVSPKPETTHTRHRHDCSDVDAHSRRSVETLPTRFSAWLGWMARHDTSTQSSRRRDRDRHFLNSFDAVAHGRWSSNRVSMSLLEPRFSLSLSFTLLILQ